MSIRTATTDTGATFSLGHDEADRIFALIESHTASLKNWIASAIEAGNVEYAQKLVKELRQHQELYATFNPYGRRPAA